MKKNLSKIQNYIGKFIKENPLGLIIPGIIIFFLILLYFTIPTYYNYENFDKEIQKKVEKNFKLNLTNIKGISYSIFPSPHFLIEECNLYFLENKKDNFFLVKNLKINVFLKNLHQKKNIEFQKIMQIKKQL